ncbi:MAG: lactonase family protein [Saprospiraceae bacterium]|nr:lactonase family protein [Saprospiraceae bacterium]
MTSIYITLFFVFLSLSGFGQTYLYVGSYTSGEKGDGIWGYELDLETGQLKVVDKQEDLVNPSFLSIAPSGQFLYACTDTKLQTDGSVSAFGIDSLTGKLTFLNKQGTRGRNPVHVVLDKMSKYVLVSNYTDAGIAVFECNADGTLDSLAQLIEFEGSSLIKGRQDQAHIHACNFSPDGKFIVAPDLGADKIRVLKFDPQNLLTVVDSLAINTKSGAGPRHFTFHPKKSFAYCIEELSGTISSYRYNHKGQLKYLATYFSYQNEDEEYASSDIHISPNGRFLYTANRQKENNIAIFKINSRTGTLRLKAHQTTYGRIPRSFVLDPSGNYLIVANQSSNEILVFRRNKRTGLLTKVHSTVGLDSPVSLKMIRYAN